VAEQIEINVAELEAQTKINRRVAEQRINKIKQSRIHRRLHNHYKYMVR
jgi:predicted regulator of amino acid metabolism with ACT domain